VFIVCVFVCLYGVDCVGVECVLCGVCSVVCVLRGCSVVCVHVFWCVCYVVFVLCRVVCVFMLRVCSVVCVQCVCYVV